MVNTTHKFKLDEKKRVALWMSEAHGTWYEPEEIKIRHGWIFCGSNEDYPDKDEIECIFLPHGNDIYGEPWGAVSLKYSPFVEKDNTKIREMCSDLTSGYKEHLLECGYTEKDWEDLIKPYAHEIVETS